MEKYGVEIDTQKKGLLEEEANLMQKLADLMSPVQGVKTAAMIHDERTKLEEQLFAIRSKLNKLDGVI